MKRTLLLIATLSVVFNASAQQKKPLKPADVYRIPVVSDPQLSPDGKWVAYSVSDVDTAKDRRVSHLWMQSFDGKESIQLTHGDEAASSPRWSPDGKYLSFLSSRDSKTGSQVWLIDRRGGEGAKLTNIKGDLGDYAWSPDGKRLVMVIGDPENKGKEEPKTPKPIVIDRYHFKQDVVGYLQHLHNHLYLIDVATKKLDTLTRGDKDESSPVWSPDSKTIAFVSNRSADPDKNQNTDIFTIDARPGASMLQLTTWSGRDSNPQWSPDGRYISYLRSTSDADYMMYDQSVVCIMDVVGQNNKPLTLQLDRPAAAQTWAKDSKNIVFIVTDDRTRYLANININSGKITTINKGDYVFNDIATNLSGNWIVQKTDPYTPAELFALEDKKLRRLTFHHDEWLNTVQLAYAKGFESTSSDGTKVSGIVLTPDSVPEKKYPLILFIHGGPVGQDEFSFDATRQTLAAAGYAVAAVNYRGSNGRGLDYCKAIYADWGNKEVKDLLGAVDELEKLGIANPDKLGIGGWSYGGILTDYTIASDTRFKAAASGAGSALQLSVYGSDQYVLQYESEIGVPWKNADKWIQISYPFFHADKIKTPVMFMSGLRDFNVPTIGSEQMYEALRTQGIPTELILYPNQFHGLTKPSYQVDRLQRYVEWYDKYLKK
ncbi:Dipeptidyl aminopeptidase/acylaminoacyl peptidase [Mucilaginibacter gossypiicola]|uniref:Acyl-peptide hydrolase n=1 Tax=Mucilaginibacter gossypiicola TaxID=551995 RepID=A0A1H8JJJ1_9SPHI|nr:S9 family peptidase [Mucilaginibacter gossypiicola]SEN80909.1 Dipeptidyl aminopeptidase/acylaminoacyl peptidase [Mucilaginibacter gossypiicola]